MIEVDCLIIGAGPTGLTLGIGLLRQGMSVLIAEKHISGLGFSKAILINSDSIKALEEFGVTDQIHAIGSVADGVSCFVDDKLVSSCNFDTSIPFHPMVLSQESTEKCLKDVFKKNGGEILNGYMFDSKENPLPISSLSEPHLIRLKNYKIESDERTLVKCTYLFGCDGINSNVRQSLNIKFSGISRPEQRNYLMDVEAESWPFTTSVSMWLSTSGLGLIIKFCDNPLTVRVVGTTLSTCQRLLKKINVKRVVWDGDFICSYRLARSYGQGNTWLAGDACHAHSPVGGRGMNIGILEAIALSNAVKTGDFNNYTTKCRRKAKFWVFSNFILSQLLMNQHWSIRIVRYFLLLAFRFFGFLLGETFALILFRAMTISVAQKKLLD